MVATREDSDLFVSYLIDQTVLVINSLGPATSKVVLQWLGLADPTEWIDCRVLDQSKKSHRLPAIRLNPPAEIIDR